VQDCRFRVPTARAASNRSYFLHYLPFHAMLDGEGRHLGDRFSISCTPSASVYYLRSQQKAAPTGGSLILGVPDAAAPCIMDEVRAVGQNGAVSERADDRIALCPSFQFSGA